MPARKKGILEMASHQFSSFVSEVEQLSPYQSEVEPKTLSGSRRKSTSEELISKTPKGITFGSGHVLIFLLQYQLAKFCSRRGEKKAALFVYTACSGKAGCHTYLNSLVCLFIYLLMASKRILALSSPELARKVK